MTDTPCLQAHEQIYIVCFTLPNPFDPHAADDVCRYLSTLLSQACLESTVSLLTFAQDHTLLLAHLRFQGKNKGAIMFERTPHCKLRSLQNFRFSFALDLA